VEYIAWAHVITFRRIAETNGCNRHSALSLIFSRAGRVNAITTAEGAFLPTPFSRTTRSLSVDSSRFVLIALGVVGVALLVWLAWFGFSTIAIYEVSRSARLEVGSAPREVVPIQSGRLSRSRLVIGQRVRMGDVLVELDATAQRLRLAEAQARLRSLPYKSSSLRRESAVLRGALINGQGASQAELQAAQARLGEARATSEFASESARRQKADSLSGGSAPVEALRASVEARKAAAARDALKADINRLALAARTRSGESEAQIESLSRAALAVESEIAATRDQIAQLNLEIENRLVRAPVDGVVGEVLPLRPGAFVTPGQKLATILPGGDLLIVAEFDPATALGRIRPGQRATLRLDGFPWAQFGSVEAKVLRVAGEVRGRSLRVEFAAAKNATHGMTLRHGLTGIVEVNIEAISPAALLLRTVGQSVAPPSKAMAPSQ
jgi:membrane fusion protein, adhesin transport system